MRALIFGASGQDGHYLAQLLQADGVEPIKVSRAIDVGISADVGDRERVRALVADLQPAYVFHLAARSTTRHEALFDNHAAISTGTLNILESVRAHAPNARVFLTGSGVQFRNLGSPISERDPFEASSAYSVARIHSVHAGRYFRSLGIRVYVGYLFHHESPRRKLDHVSRIVASAAVRIAGGIDKKLQIGDVSVEKEWTFAGDVASAIWTLIRQDRVMEATIGSGLAYSIEHWLEACFARVDLRWSDHVTLKPGFAPEYSRLVSDPSSILALGWRPRVSIDELAAMMVAAERARLCDGPEHD
jgi:GDPmannose 4,6-dehydratase